jgi:cold shock CspA family protein
MRTGTVKNESKGYGFITDEETGKDILFMLQESTRKNYAKETELAKEEEGRKVAAKVELSTKKKFFAYESKTFRFIRNVFFTLISKLHLKTKIRNYYYNDFKLQDNGFSL